jgi:hypothetical protein
MLQVFLLYGLINKGKSGVPTKDIEKKLMTSEVGIHGGFS